MLTVSSNIIRLYWKILHSLQDYKALIMLSIFFKAALMCIRHFRRQMDKNEKNGLTEPWSEKHWSGIVYSSSQPGQL